MKTTDDYPSWCRGIISKRTPDALAVFADLLRAGLARGECSPNDVADRNLDESNIIGGVFQTLPSIGFYQTSERVKPLATRKNGRKLFVWKLVERWRAEAFMNALPAPLRRGSVPEQDQQLLRM